MSERLSTEAGGPQRPLDYPLTYTWFPNKLAFRKTERRESLRQLGGRILKREADTKAGLPYLKLATFGDVRTAKRCLRHDKNLLLIYGIEGDYDAGAVSMAEAKERLRRHRIAALLYATASHTPGKPRWRVLAPLSKPHAPADRDQLCAVLNGALGGILSAESFARSQSFYYGHLTGTVGTVLTVNCSLFLDQAAGVAPIGKPRAARTNKVGSKGREGELPPRALVLDALQAIPNSPDRMPAGEEGQDYHTHLYIGAALFAAFGEDGFAIWDEWSSQSPKYNQAESNDDKWEQCKALTAPERTEHPVTAAKILGIARDDYGWDKRDVLTRWWSELADQSFDAESDDESL